ncbi:MAG TPA: DUF2235 domain-containing protein [Longimicrobiales bacterium]|nr:DUF2235 domain-containing protein [Longimicrobiales bacterium]
MKRLVLCCDGTWNRADQKSGDEPCPTNVVKLAYRVAKRDPAGVPQIVYYDHGVGTGNTMDRLSGGAFGHGLEDNIHDAYRFLVGNYEEGDEIFLFGFSRGAFTARSVAGMVRNCGILRRESVRHYTDAIALYHDGDRHPDHAESVDFRGRHSVCGEGSVPIRFIGAWDTVGALGIPVRGLKGLTRRRHQFHDAELSGSVQLAFHALAIDERRAPFAPTLWFEKPKDDQVVRQVWFAGVHSDVGGGYPEDGLSDITLDWMLRAARREGGLALAEMADYALDPRPLARKHESRKGVYRLSPGADRPIGLRVTHQGKIAGEPDATQSVHPSVRERWERDRGWRPPGLREYFHRTGDPLAEL